MSETNKESLTAKHYANKIVDVAYYEAIPNKETVSNVIDALINEFSNQQTKALQEKNERYKNAIASWKREENINNEWIADLQSELTQVKEELAKIKKAFLDIADVVVDLNKQNKQLADALWKIQIMKKNSATEDYEFVFNRCWHIATEALTNYKKTN